MNIGKYCRLRDGRHGVSFLSKNSLFSVGVVDSFRWDEDERPSYVKLMDEGLNELVHYEMNRPQGFVVSDTGIVFGFDCKFSKESYSAREPREEFHVMAYNGEEEIFSKKLMSPPDKSCISNDGRFAAFSTLMSEYIDSGSVFLVDLRKSEVVMIVNVVGCENVRIYTREVNSLVLTIVQNGGHKISKVLEFN